MSQQAENKSAERPSLPTRRLYRYLIILPIAAGILAGASWLVLRPRTDHFYTDGQTIRESAATAPLRDILWQPPVKVGDLVNSADNEYEPRLSADGMTLYFVRGKAGNNAGVFFAERTPEGWTTAQPLAPVNTTWDELGPAPSADGRSLYFYSDRPGGFGGYDLWVIRRGLDEHSDFGEATNLGPAVNSEFNDYGPALSPDGRALYFASNRPQPGEVDQPVPDAWPATVREDLFYRTYDLYYASINEGGISPARPLSTLNTPYNEGAPAISPFDDFLYFASDRPGGAGSYDLYRSRRLDGRYEPPTNLGTALNTSANELDPGLAMGGYALYFSSDRPSDSVPAGRALPYHIYRSTSREVFSQSEVQPRSFDWAAVWAAVAPNLLWMLLALFLLLLLLALMRGLEGRPLSLLARCLLASLAAHLMLMLLFNVWGVTTRLGDVLRKRGAIRVALVASAKGGDLVSQIRGKFTDIETPQTPVMNLTRAVPQLADRTTAAMVTSPIQHSAPTPAEPMKVDQPLKDAVVDKPTRIPPTEQLSLSDHRPALEVTVPEESERANHAESNSLNVPASPVSAEVTRAEMSRDLSRLARPPTPVAIAPAEDAGGTLAMFEHSLTDASAGSETESSPPAMLPPLIADRWPQQDSMAELTLPQPERREQRENDSSERSIHVAAAQLTPPRSLGRFENATDVIHESLREISPESSEPAPPSISLAVTEAPRLLAEDIGVGLGDVDTLPAAALPNVPLNELALPDLEQPVSTTQAESSWETPEDLSRASEQVGRAPVMLDKDDGAPRVETAPADRESVNEAVKAAL
ncbi:MAG: hypothetical protein KJ749_08700, partial [Planctomycetes bacterium]|nr:hypothetical protein [Planctomycetota bacterium]